MKPLALLIASVALAYGADQTSIQLAWDASPSTNIAGYTLHIAEQPGSFTNSVSTVDIPGDTLTAKAVGLENGKVYYFTVSAYNDVGLRSGPSNEVGWTNDYPANPPNLRVTSPVQIVINVNVTP